VNSKEGAKFSEVEYREDKKALGTFVQYDGYGNVVKKE